MTAFRIAPQTIRPKQKRVKSESHLDFIRSLPCVLTGQYGVDAIHVRYGDSRYGKENPGVGQKPSDWWTLPMIRELHAEQHSMDEREFWNARGIDPLPVAMALYLCERDITRAIQILESVNRRRT